MLPFLGLIAAGAAALGLIKGYQAHSDNESANEIQYEAQSIFKSANANLERVKTETTLLLNQLGAVKIGVWSHQMGRFAALYGRVRRYRLRGRANYEASLPKLTRVQLGKMRDVSFKASAVVPTALGAGSLTAIATYGGVAMMGTASTGTAIGTLSGVAASNATLAWLGGGSLAVGGAGVAGGIAILGGLVLGPAIAVGGLLMANAAQANLAHARELHAKAVAAAAEMNRAADALQRLGGFSSKLADAIGSLAVRLESALGDLESLVRVKEAAIPHWRFILERCLGRWLGLTRVNYTTLTESERRTVDHAAALAQATRLLLETPLLDGSGSLSSDCTAALAAVSESFLLPVRQNT